MAVTLTTNWQPVASSTWAPGTGFSITFYLDAKYSTQSTVNNNTTIQTRLNTVINQGYGSGYNYSFTCSYAPTVSGSGLWTFANETITSGGDTIKHNDDGTKTITLSASAKVTGAGLNISFSGDAILPKIDRYATLTSAPDFNDEANPKITFTKNVATGATVYAGIFNSAGTTAYASYRSVGNASAIATGEYTFNLTSAERTSLRNAATTNSLQVQFKLYTTINGTNFDGGSITKTMSITNANPTLTSPTYSEQNAKVSALLGSSGSTVVQNASTLRVGITATALKSASISKVVATHSGSTYTDTSSPYSFDIPIKSNSITLTATDSRTNTGTLNITKTMLAYTPVAINTFSFKRQTETSSTIILNLSATYYQQTFGSTANAPIVKWKKDNGSWTTLTSSQYTIDNTNHKLTVSNLSLGDQVDYEHEATFTIYIEDKLSTAQNSAKVTIGIPTLDVGKEDLIVNGKVNVIEAVNRTSNTDTYITANASWANKRMGFGIGSGGSNRGIWDYSLNKWTFYTDGSVLYCNGNTNINGVAKATNGFWSRPSGEVGTATSANSCLLIKRASNSEAPNNGVVLEYGNSTNYKGQLFIGDNATQGIYYNGWSNGTRGSWRRLNEVGVSLYDNTTGTNGTVTLSETSANFKYLEIYYRNNDQQYDCVRVYNPNSKSAGLMSIFVTTTSSSSDTYFMFKGARITISGTSITKNGYCEGNLYNETTLKNKQNNTYIVKVLGYYN